MIIKDKIKKFRIFIFINIILATVIGIYAQDIAYYIVGDYSVNIAQLYLYILTVLTILSIILLVTKVKKTDEYIPFGPFIVIATFISMYVPFEQIKMILMQIFTLGMYKG